MSLSVDEVFSQALQLPDESKECLAERLMVHLAAKLDPGLERERLELAKRRRDEVRAGLAPPLDEATVLDQARRVIGE